MPPYTLHKSVRRIPQSSPDLCWEACARMSYLWKFPGHVQKYERLVSRWAQQNRGLTRHEMGLVYAHTLGMKTHPKPLQVITKSPLIWCEINKAAGHASLLIGFHPKHGFINYNPGSQMSAQTAIDVMAPSEKIGEPKMQMAGNVHFISVAAFEKIFSGTAWGYYV